MTLDTQHPEYSAITDDYRQMRDVLAGQRTIKQKGFLYLPPTVAMALDGAYAGTSPGFGAYLAYSQRAVFPEHTAEAQATMVGLLNKELAEITVPERMIPLLDNITRQGESAWQLLRRINEAQLGYGRVGLLVDVAPNAKFPHIVTYAAETITNWDDERATETARSALSFVVFNEDAWVRGGEAVGITEWEPQTRFRAAVINEVGLYETYVEVDGVVQDRVVPSFAGTTLPNIPFVFIGANDMIPTPGKIPLLGVSNIALTIYRGEADFRQTLHVQGQDTLVLVGVEDDKDGEPTRIGTGAKILLPEGGKAEFIGISSDGLSEQRSSLENDYGRSTSMGARLLENSGSQAESGEALRVRVSAKTTTLHSIALTAAAGLEDILKQIAVWIGEDPTDIRVNPNLDFIEDKANPEELDKLLDSKLKGAPLSYESIHEWAAKNELTQLTFEEEMKRIATEAALVTTLKAGMVVEPADPNAQNLPAPNTTEE